jgi:uncharacterized membrane protein
MREETLLLRTLHLLALTLWLAAPALYAARISRGRRGGGEAGELAARRRGQRLLVFEHVALAGLLLSGFVLMWLLGTRPGLRWLALKLGIVAFLVAPLEAMHAYIVHVWIARGLQQTAAPPFAKDLARGISVQRMILTLALPLLGLAVPLLVWLSLARPR